MKGSLEATVGRRSRNACEYCRIPQAAYRLSVQIDHIIAKQHGGKTHVANLALACPRCNRNKGPNISSIDINSRSLVLLFNPRKDRWTDHFRWRGARLLALTPTGRVTIRLLAINHPDSVALRRLLILDGSFPPKDDPGAQAIPV
jgi:HNH endonuclease